MNTLYGLLFSLAPVGVAAAVLGTVATAAQPLIPHTATAHAKREFLAEARSRMATTHSATDSARVRAILDQYEAEAEADCRQDPDYTTCMENH